MTVILVVEDDRSLARLAQLNLEAIGHRVVVCKEGGGALTYLQANRPDLVLLDLMLPTISGWELLTYLHGDERLCGVPVLILTAMAQPEDRQKAQLKGTTEYLVKPFAIRELLDTVGRLLTDVAHG